MPQFSSPGEPFLTHPHPYRPMAAEYRNLGQDGARYKL